MDSRTAVYQLTIPAIMRRAGALSSGRRIVSRGSDGTTHRYPYRDFLDRVHRLAVALAALGLGDGDRIATLAWNDHRHLEAYFAIPSMGAVLHTLNVRLHHSELTYIVGHAG